MLLKYVQIVKDTAPLNPCRIAVGIRKPGIIVSKSIKTPISKNGLRSSLDYFNIPQKNNK